MRETSPHYTKAALNYKYMFGPRRLYLICETSQWNTVMKQSKGLNGDLKSEHKKTTQNHAKSRPYLLTQLKTIEHHENMPI